MWISVVSGNQKEKNQKMTLKIGYDKLAIILGGLTLILFSAKPYILDLIEPAKSIGQVIGENAKDLINTMNGKKEIETSNTKREIWSNIITILSFILFAASIILSINTIQNSTKKWYGIGGGILSIAGLGIYLTHLAIGLIGFIVIAILVVAIVTIGGG